MATVLGGTVDDHTRPDGLAGSDDGDGRRRTWPPTGRWFTVVGVASLVLPVVAYLGFVHHFAVDVVWSDQWSDVNLLQHVHNGTLTLGTLWAQHTSNRIFFPNVIVAALGPASHGNVVAEEYLSAGLLVLSTALVVLAHRRRSPRTPWLYYCPVVLLTFTFVGGNPYYGGPNALWGFDLSWYLVLLCLSAALYLLDRPDLTGWAVAGAVVSAVVGSYSSTQGLLIWPVGLLLLWLRRRAPLRLGIWVVSALATTALFLVHYDTAAGMSQPGYLVSHPVESVTFFLFSIGDNLWGQVTTVPPGFPDVVVGAGVLVLALWVVIRFGTRRDEDTPAPIGVALVVYGLLFTALVTGSRAWQGFFQAGRYNIFEVLVWIGCYLAVLGRVARQASGAVDRGARVATVALVGLVALSVLVGDPKGWTYAQADHTHQLEAADVMVHMPAADDALVYATDGGWDAGWVRPLDAFARSAHLSVFDTALGAHLAATGLAPAIQSSLTRPAAGASVSGRVLLVGTANLSTRPAGFEFLVSGGPVAHRLVSPVTVPGTPTAHRYVGEWDSRAVADGYYDVHTVVVHPDGTRAVGDPVVVQAVNHAATHHGASR